MEVIINGRRYIPERPRPATREVPFRRLLREAREAHGWSPDRVAEAVGISKTYLRELEAGQAADPSLRIAGALADLYGLELAELAMALDVRE